MKFLKTNNNEISLNRLTIFLMILLSPLTIYSLIYLLSHLNILSFYNVGINFDNITFSDFYVIFIYAINIIVAGVFSALSYTINKNQTKMLLKQSELQESANNTQKEYNEKMIQLTAIREAELIFDVSSIFHLVIEPKTYLENGVSFELSDRNSLKRRLFDDLRLIDFSLDNFDVLFHVPFTLSNNGDNTLIVKEIFLRLQCSDYEIQLEAESFLQLSSYNGYKRESDFIPIAISKQNSVDKFITFKVKPEIQNSDKRRDIAYKLDTIKFLEESKFEIILVTQSSKNTNNSYELNYTSYKKYFNNILNESLIYAVNDINSTISYIKELQKNRNTLISNRQHLNVDDSINRTNDEIWDNIVWLFSGYNQKFKVKDEN